MPISHLFFFFKCLLSSSAHFSIGLVVYLLLNCRSSLFILEAKPLLVVSFTNIFYQSVGLDLSFESWFCHVLYMSYGTKLSKCHLQHSYKQQDQWSFPSKIVWTLATLLKIGTQKWKKIFLSKLGHPTRGIICHL